MVTAALLCLCMCHTCVITMSYDAFSLKHWLPLLLCSCMCHQHGL
jgi:hypothetical protein